VESISINGLSFRMIGRSDPRMASVNEAYLRFKGAIVSRAEHHHFDLAVLRFYGNVVSLNRCDRAYNVGCIVVRQQKRGRNKDNQCARQIVVPLDKRRSINYGIAVERVRQEISAFCVSSGKIARLVADIGKDRESLSGYLRAFRGFVVRGRRR
jgi:hypothetical protein